jgi:hypothetical protein
MRCGRISHVNKDPEQVPRGHNLVFALEFSQHLPTDPFLLIFATRCLEVACYMDDRNFSVISPIKDFFPSGRVSPGFQLIVKKLLGVLAKLVKPRPIRFGSRRLNIGRCKKNDSCFGNLRSLGNSLAIEDQKKKAQNNRPSVLKPTISSFHADEGISRRTRWASAKWMTIFRRVIAVIQGF